MKVQFVQIASLKISIFQIFLKPTLDNINPNDLKRHLMVKK